MVKRLVAVLLLGCFLIAFPGCYIIWGTDRGHDFADAIAAGKKSFDEPNRHALTHIEIILRDFREMHEFWDRYFMNYDWDDPYID